MSSSVANGKSMTRVASGRLGRSAPKRTAVQEVPLKLVKREINSPSKVNVLHQQTDEDENNEEDEGDAIYSNTSDETDSESDDVDCEMAVGHRSRIPPSASTLTCPGDVSSCLSASTFLALPRLLSHTLSQVCRFCIPLVPYQVSQSFFFPLCPG